MTPSLEKTIGSNKILAINIISNIVMFGANLIINFFLSPYIVKKLGVEANGFITLANNFVSYASLVAIVLNSMAGRFITVRYYQNDIEGANKYYSTVTIANFVFAVFIIAISLIVVNYLEYFLAIPLNLVIDVKLLFILILINFSISTAISSWETATFVTNKLYLQSMRKMTSQLLRAFVILTLFFLFQPAVYYVGVATVLATLYTAVYSYYYKIKLLPRMKIQKKYFDFRSLLDLISSGVWNTITHAGQILLSGLDLLITNLFLGPTAMGLFGLSKTLPTVVTQLAGTLTSVFTPSLTIYYAQGDIIGLTKELKKSMKITGAMLTVPLSILFVFGKEFYSLWVPTENANILQVLSILTIFGLIFTSGIQSLYTVFTVVNKLKVYSMLILFSGVVSTIIVFILLNTTNMGIYAVAIVSSVVNLIRNMFFTIPLAAKYLDLKWNTFFPEVFYSIISVLLSVSLGLIIKSFFTIETWMTLVICVIFTGVFALLVNVLVVLNKKERSYLLDLFKRKLRMGKRIIKGD